ncbi:hypothetical protein AHAS_Ahas02G0064200 [Arachis hypogaea]
MWLGIHNALSSNRFRHRRSLVRSSMCHCCNIEEEDILHCFRDYIKARCSTRWELVERQMIWTWTFLSGLDATFLLMNASSRQRCGGFGKIIITIFSTGGLMEHCEGNVFN